MCNVCPAGTVTGLTQTNAPPAANQSDRIGPAAIAAYRCDECPYRTFRPSMYAANICTPCPKGRETKKASGAATCNACPPGYTLLMVNASSWDLACTACHAGEQLQGRLELTADTACTVA